MIKTDDYYTVKLLPQVYIPIRGNLSGKAYPEEDSQFNYKLGRCTHKRWCGTTILINGKLNMNFSGRGCRIKPSDEIVKWQSLADAWTLTSAKLAKSVRKAADSDQKEGT